MSAEQKLKQQKKKKTNYANMPQDEKDAHNLQRKENYQVMHQEDKWIHLFWQR